LNLQQTLGKLASLLLLCAQKAAFNIFKKMLKRLSFENKTVRAVTATEESLARVNFEGVFGLLLMRRADL